MVFSPVICPHCDSDNVVKNGHDHNGNQRYLCKNSECTHKAFITNYTYNAYNPKTRRQVLDLTVNGNGTRAIARVLRIAPNTVTALLKKKKNGCNKLIGDTSKRTEVHK